MRAITDPLDPHDYIHGIEDNWMPAIGQGWDNFSRRGYSITNLIEWEAIRQLGEERSELPKRPPMHQDAEFERWRALWVNEAFHIRKFTHPGSAEYAAAEILIRGSQLRAAIEDGEPERAAALGALMMCYAIAGGYSLKMEATAAAHEAIRKAKAATYKRTIGRDADDLARARGACIRWASQWWSEDDSLLIGTVARWARENLIKHRAKLPTLEKFPTQQTIKEWLKDAAKNGKLVIPRMAQRRGRPKKPRADK